MNTVLLGLITAAVVAAGVVFMVVMFELRTAVRALKDLIKTTECSCAPLKPTLEELQMTLKSVRDMTDNINGVAGDVRELSGSIKDVGEKVRHVSELVDDVTSLTVGRVSGLKAGINAAIEVLLKNLFRKRG